MKKTLLLLLLVSSLRAQPTYDKNIPAPDKVIGYELGEKFTSHANIEKYIFKLGDAAPDRIKIFPYGQTYEGRTLYIVVAGSAENLGRLDEIKTDVGRLADPRKTDIQEAEKIIGHSPVIAWLSYGVHGNEASCSEAALGVMYELAARTDDEIGSLLRNVVVVIDPLLNPDGHERYVNFQTARAGRKAVEDRAAAEHGEDWPGSRSNHYFFDLNRDWAWLTQKETEARIALYHEWKPQLHIDFHEMGYNSSYFFFPSFKPVNKNIPQNTVEWGEIYGRANASAFDAKGWSYWSGEIFDLFYPGFGDSWPSLNGAVGMTYEQAGQVGVRVKRNDESILTLKERLEHHIVASIASLKATSDNREKRLRDFYTFFRDAIDEGKKGNIKGFIVDPSKDLSKASEMIALLLKQGVEVSKAGKGFRLDGISTYFQKKPLSKEFPAGSYIIPLDQPSKHLIMTLMEEEPAMSDTFFYDIATWALPVAYGVETYWTGKLPDIPSVNMDSAEYPPGSVIGDERPYAYVFRWNSNDAIRALIWLLQHDYKVHAAMKEFKINGEKFERGSVIIPVNNNPNDIHERLRELASQNHLTIFKTKSGYTEGGIDLGSDRAVRLKKPKIIVITNSPVSSESFGAIWSMFDNEYGIDFVPMKTDRLRYTDLHDYTTMIFPDDWSNGSRYKSDIDSGTVQKIKTWIAGGGTYIGIEGGAAFASASVGKISGVKFKEKKKDEGEKKKEDKKEKEKEEKLSDEEIEKRMTVEEKERKQRLANIPGTMLSVKLDNSHPLGFGYDTLITVLKTSGTMYELSPSGYNVGIYRKKPRMSGYISEENEKLLGETPFLVHEKLGSGNIILFADDPNFRLFWKNLNKLFLNGVLLMPSIRDVAITADEN